MLNILQLNRNIRSIRRYRQIGLVLFKYGFDQLLETLNLTALHCPREKDLRRNGTKIASFLLRKG